MHSKILQFFFKSNKLKNLFAVMKLCNIKSLQNLATQSEILINDDIMNHLNLNFKA